MSNKNSPTLTVTVSAAARLYLDRLAFPENAALHNDESADSSQTFPLAAKASALIHCNEKPAGIPVVPAATVISIDVCVEVAHVNVGVDIAVVLFFPPPEVVELPGLDESSFGSSEQLLHSRIRERIKPTFDKCFIIMGFKKI